MFCPFCGVEKKGLKVMVPHVGVCSQGPKGDHARASFYWDFYQYKKADFVREYVEEHEGLRSIFVKRSIPYKVLKFLAGHEGILRNKEDVCHWGIEKTKRTLFERYGTSNPRKTASAQEKIRQKGTVTRVKKSEAMKRVWSREGYRDSTLKRMTEAITNKYGVANVFSLPEYQNKAKESILEKFGVDNISRSDYKRKLMVARGRYTPENEKSEFVKYKEAVKNETYKWLKDLFEVWKSTGGQCYYTLDSLFDSFGNKLPGRGNEPSVDHKVSVVFGYLNDIPSEVIGSPKNLCICYRWVNSAKGSLTEHQFRKKRPDICSAERWFG